MLKNDIEQLLNKEVTVYHKYGYIVGTLTQGLISDYEIEESDSKLHFNFTDVHDFGGKNFPHIRLK
jgi:hypothetical protein